MGELHMEYKRTIQFRYFRVLCREKGSDNKWGGYKTFDLVKWITQMDLEQKLQKSIRFGNTLARIEHFSHSPADDLWGIHLMKLRDTNIPSKVKENEASEPVELDDDEYLGEDISLLYEKSSSIIMIQMNRFSLGISKLEEFFNYTNNKENIEISLKAIIETDKLKKLKHCNYKSIEISFANVNKWRNDDECKSLSSIISLIKETGGYAGAVKIGLGYSKNTVLNKIESGTIVREVLENRAFIRGAKVKVNDDDEKGTEVIDLFEEIYHDFIEFTLPSKTALQYQTAFESMRYYFSQRKSALYEAIEYKNN